MSVITMEEAAERIRMQNAYEAGVEEGKYEMTEKMLANGIDPVIVANIAGLPVDEVQSLVRE